jgi:hypothetical protein
MNYAKSDFEQAEFEEKITDLINLSELYFSIANLHRELFDEFYSNQKDPIAKQKILSHPITSNIILHANSYLFLSITGIHTLLKTNSKSEISFAKYFNKYGKPQREIEDLRQFYKKSKLDQVRDKIIAHKDIKNIGDPGTLAVILVDRNFFQSVDEINSKLNKIIGVFFESAHANNPLLDLCENGIKSTINFYRDLLNEAK